MTAPGPDASARGRRLISLLGITTLRPADEQRARLYQIRLLAAGAMVRPARRPAVDDGGLPPGIASMCVLVVALWLALLAQGTR